MLKHRVKFADLSAAHQLFIVRRNLVVAGHFKADRPLGVRLVGGAFLGFDIRTQHMQAVEYRPA
jgi:hypothetical protein